jgi:regulator of PEP synthase PpsR (kinase-PPPase family)
VTIPEYDDRELSDEDEEMIRLIRGPLGSQNPRPRPKAIIILSDTTGVTAKSAVEKSLAQFNGCDERYMVTYMSEMKDDIENEDTDCENLTTQIYPFVKADNEIASIIQRVAERKNAIVVFTLSDPILWEQTSCMCTIENIPHVDLLGPMYDSMAIFFNRQPFGTDAYKRSSDPFFLRAGTVRASGLEVSFHGYVIIQAIFGFCQLDSVKMEKWKCAT